MKRDVNVLMCSVCDAGQRCRHPGAAAVKKWDEEDTEEVVHG